MGNGVRGIEVEYLVVAAHQHGVLKAKDSDSVAAKRSLSARIDKTGTLLALSL
jgi:hypothetical protein